MSKRQETFGQVRIAQHQNQPWNGFILQKNHFFGEDEHGFFVTAGKPTLDGAMIVYRCPSIIPITQNVYLWHTINILPKHPLYQKILDKKAEHKYPVNYGSPKYQAKQIRKPEKLISQVYFLRDMEQNIF